MHTDGILSTKMQQSFSHGEHKLAAGLPMGVVESTLRQDLLRLAGKLFICKCIYTTSTCIIASLVNAHGRLSFTGGEHLPENLTD